MTLFKVADFPDMTNAEFEALSAEYESECIKESKALFELPKDKRSPAETKHDRWKMELKHRKRIQTSSEREALGLLLGSVFLSWCTAYFPPLLMFAVPAWMFAVFFILFCMFEGITTSIDNRSAEKEYRVELAAEKGVKPVKPIGMFRALITGIGIPVLFMIVLLATFA